MDGSSGLRTASIILFWCTAASWIFVVAALVNRRSAWVDLTDGGRDVVRLNDADDLGNAAFAVTFLLALASLILVSLWSLRVARRARRAGATDVSPGLACGSWYIPYASAIVPFIPLRRSARRGGRPTAMLNLWQALYITIWVVGTLVLGLEPSDEDATAVVLDPSSITDKLTAQLVFAVIGLIVMAVMAFAAMQAVRALDDS